MQNPSPGNPNRNVPSSQDFSLAGRMKEPWPWSDGRAPEPGRKLKIYTGGIEILSYFNAYNSRILETGFIKTPQEAEKPETLDLIVCFLKNSIIHLESFFTSETLMCPDSRALKNLITYYLPECSPVEIVEHSGLKRVGYLKKYNSDFFSLSHSFQPGKGLYDSWSRTFFRTSNFRAPNFSILNLNISHINLLSNSE